MRTARPYRLLSSQTAGTAASRCLAASSTTTCHRSKREKASDIDELVRKHCCKMPSPNDPTAHRGGHMICFMWSAECGYEELAECLDHFCYRLGSGSARHALLTTSLPHALPSSSQRCRLAAAAVLAVHLFRARVELFRRGFQKCTATRAGCALFVVRGAGTAALGCQVYHKGRRARCREHAKSLLRF